MPYRLKRISDGKDINHMYNNAKKPTSTKGIKMAIFGRSKTNHYTGDFDFAICSECFHEVALAHKYCWHCGVKLSDIAHKANFEQMTEYRKEFQEKEDEEEEFDED